MKSSLLTYYFFLMCKLLFKFLSIKQSVDERCHLNLSTLPFLQICQCISAQFTIFATLKKKKKKKESVFSLCNFKFLSPVWTSQLKLSESLITVD